MLTFHKIRWKNILSTGNSFTEIELSNTPNALIIGDNGAGKSTILDALCFVLFGKPFRKISKSNLVNSVNQKGTEVEIEFEVNNKKYKVIRGIKPNIFEIYCDGLCLNQDSASKDYQDYLEKFIIKMNYKTFCQIVILGSASFTPFMQLTPADRRAVIEDLLDIQIFSSMTALVKQRMQVNKESLEKNRISLAFKEEKKTFIEKSIISLKQNNENKLNALKKQYQDNEGALQEFQTEIEILENNREKVLSKTQELTNLKQKHQKLIKLQSQIETKASRHQSDVSFYEKNFECPTCGQGIDEAFKGLRLEEHKCDLEKLQKGLEDISIEIDKVFDRINEIDELLKQSENLRNEITSLKSKKSSVISVLSSIKDQITNFENSDIILNQNENELSDTISELDNLKEERRVLSEEKLLIDTAITLLKDGGIKTKIIKQYLPIINKLINKYLLKMGFFVNFNINEQFEETIKSRYCDEFSYQNFSEGEKTRIDLAILFAWRAVAKLKNSANTNLLIFDEIFDGSLDNNGTDEFLNIIWSLTSDTNTFVISHKKDQMIDKFRKVYKFVKVKNFSRLDT